MIYAVADEFLLDDSAIDIGSGQFEAENGRTVGESPILPRQLSGVGGNGRLEVQHGAVGHIGISILQAGHVGAIAEVTNHTSGVVEVGESSIGITLTTEQIEVITINLELNCIDVVEEVLIHIITIGVLIKDAVAPQQLNTEVGFLTVHQILANRHTDDTGLGVEVAPNPGIVGLYFDVIAFCSCIDIAAISIFAKIARN